ncbi:solute carrier family 15 member 2-like [Paramacrobiotus metropolitanus]|uniref:solute carrier family 15 member 2-like n=1 Tax=Paramacrobiotus metropolitanus TaxID=2943436 RepID=UPI002445B6DE|nr:solute carrier family 15 member 2-like [Paramacrobiotus metropolitanus]
MSSSNEKDAGDNPKSEFIMKELNRISQKSGPVTAMNKTDSSGTISVDSISIQKTPKYPWYIIFILGNELCERFAFYGMKAVLTLYFLQAFMWSESTSTLVYHVFLVLSYFTPVFGAMLADGYIGKFATIFLLSLVYVGGLVLMTLASIPPIGLHPIAGFVSGLLLVAVGTGGIKPCVVTYGGDQFVTGQERYREQFFSVFYFCINAGSLVSTFVTPILRSDVSCFDQEGCYPAAFGLPAGLLAVAVVLFVVGRPFYRNIPPTGNIVGKVLACIWHALANKFRKNKPRGVKHWLDYASDKYDAAFISDVKKVMPVLKMFLPLPIFWTLFDQKGSRWTLQANKMDGRITDSFYWKPDQVQIFNPVLILILVPIFETIIFPLIERCGFKFRLLARMVTGMLLAGGAFVIAGFLQIELDKTVPIAPAPGQANLYLFNTMPCPYFYDLRNLNATEPDITLQSNQMYTIKDISLDKVSMTFDIPLHPQFDNCSIRVSENHITIPWTMLRRDRFSCPVRQENMTLK